MLRALFTQDLNSQIQIVLKFDFIGKICFKHEKFL